MKRRDFLVTAGAGVALAAAPLAASASPTRLMTPEDIKRLPPFVFEDQNGDVWGKVFLHRLDPRTGTGQRIPTPVADVDQDKVPFPGVKEPTEFGAVLAAWMRQVGPIDIQIQRIGFFPDAWDNLVAYRPGLLG